jgi:hypothetical protein
MGVILVLRLPCHIRSLDEILQLSVQVCMSSMTDPAKLDSTEPRANSTSTRQADNLLGYSHRLRLESRLIVMGNQVGWSWFFIRTSLPVAWRSPVPYNTILPSNVSSRDCIISHLGE